MLAENKITLASLYKILFEEEPLTLSDQCMQKLEESFHFLKTFSNDKIIYGINTGFGPMAQYRIEDESLSQLQYNIIRRDRKSTRLNSSHKTESRMPSSA